MSAISVTAAKVAAQINTVTRSYIAAEALTAGNAVYQTTDGTVGIADANASGKQQFFGIALETVGSGSAVTVAHKGIVDGFAPAGNCGTLLYLSDTVGGLDTSAGSMTVAVGKVVLRSDSTKTIFFDTQWLADWS
jgi:hypothetical protein